MAKKSRWTMPTPTLEVVAAEEVTVVVDVEAVDSADVVLDVEAAEDMIAEIAMAEIAKADSVVEEEEVEEVSVVVEADEVEEAVAATTATKKVILPENAQRVLLDPIRRSISNLPQKSGNSGGYGRSQY